MATAEIAPGAPKYTVCARGGVGECLLPTSGRVRLERHSRQVPESDFRRSSAHPTKASAMVKPARSGRIRLVRHSLGRNGVGYLAARGRCIRFLTRDQTGVQYTSSRISPTSTSAVSKRVIRVVLPLSAVAVAAPVMATCRSPEWT